MEKTTLKKKVLKTTERAFEVLALGAGLTFGVIYLDPMSIKSAKQDISYQSQMPKTPSYKMEGRVSEPLLHGFEAVQSQKTIEL